MEIPNTAQNLQANPKKRPSDCNVNIQDSNYFKIRAVLKDLRPHFLEVLRTPDFQTSKAALEIGQQMKVLMKLYEEMTSESVTMERCKNLADGGHDQKKPADGKATETQPPPPLEKERVFIRKASEERPTSEMLEAATQQGSYIVGGSAFGWNFITYPSSILAAYYGRGKEEFRAANPIMPPTLENLD
ncbi:uncharacterized protein LOC112523048 [Cynara cardunculus var. scolymus]|uniref:Uncharacterized protein n=1 Tax=Cynara cardunculus var. scolymus TaxID=59895 RepID=A0A124SDK7_CYNCS|nr:uncharacterized protein LOC112523048 [Cynara cardunculus var. scolymus]KVH97240.1 hypothetical protein Ccrd_000662 [Cynara cardunculus var. scolymus]